MTTYLLNTNTHSDYCHYMSSSKNQILCTSPCADNEHWIKKYKFKNKHGFQCDFHSECIRNELRFKQQVDKDKRAAYFNYEKLIK